MNNYEVLYVIDATIDDEAIKEQVQKFSDLVTNNGGEIVDINEWGKRRLAYQINYKSEGYYVLMNFKSDPDFPVELERNFGINESIMRYMVERKVDGYVPPKKVARAKFDKPKTEEKPLAEANKKTLAEAEAPEAVETTEVVEAKKEAVEVKEETVKTKKAPVKKAPAKKTAVKKPKKEVATPAEETVEAPAEKEAVEEAKETTEE